MVRTAKEGFERVLADEDGTFAFIHEASQVQMYKFKEIQKHNRNEVKV